MTSDVKCLALIFLFPVLFTLTLCEDSQLEISDDSNDSSSPDNILLPGTQQKRDWRKFATWGKRKWSGLSTWGKRNWAGLSTWGKRDSDQNNDLDKRWANFETWGKRWSPNTALSTWGKRTLDKDDNDMDKRKWSQFATWGKRSPGKWASFSTWGKRDDEDPVDKRKWSSFSTWGKRNKWMGLSTWGKRSDDPSENELALEALKILLPTEKQRQEAIEFEAFLHRLMLERMEQS